jgi:putative membrane protein
MPAAFAHLTHPQHAEADLLGWMLPVLVAAALVASYVLAVHRYSRRARRPWPASRTISLTTGSAILLVAVSPPLQVLAHDDLRGHMLQHLLIGMFAPLALVLAAPMTLLLALVSPARARVVAAALRSGPIRVLTHPVTAGIITTAGIYVLYLTPLYAATAQSAVLHHSAHVHFLLAGYLFTWSIAGPDPAPHRPGLPTRIAVLVAAAGAHAFLAKLLYAHAPALPPGAGHDLAEIHQAAQLMYYGGDLAELMLAAALSVAWHHRRGPRSRRGRRRGMNRSGDARGPSPVDVNPLGVAVSRSGLTPGSARQGGGPAAAARPPSGR